MQRLGLWRARARATTMAAPWESPLDAARREVLEAARRQPWAQDGVQALYDLADFLRLSRRKVTALRGLVAAAENIDAGWIVLVRAARVESLVEAIEAEVDELLAEGRVA